MVKHCGLADTAVVETPVTAADGDTTIADVVYFDSLSGERAILEVSVVTVGSDTSLARISRAGLDSIMALTPLEVPPLASVSYQGDIGSWRGHRLMERSIATVDSFLQPSWSSPAVVPF